MSKDMNNKFLNVLLASVVAIIVIPIFFGTMFFSYVLRSTEKKIIVVVIRAKTNIETVKEEISKIPHVKKIAIDYKDEQWDDMDNELEDFGMGIRNKDQVKIRVDKQKNLKKVFDKVSQLDYAENVNYFPDTGVFDGVGRAFKVDR